MTLQAVGILEAKVAARDRSPARIAALARALGNTGDATGAARLLESLIVERPHDRSVLNTLAEFQHASGRNERLIHTLETLQDITPRINRQRKLAKLYTAFDRRTEQLDALRGLVGQRVAELDEYSSLARLEASMGRPLAGAAEPRRALPKSGGCECSRTGATYVTRRRSSRLAMVWTASARPGRCSPEQLAIC